MMMIFSSCRVWNNLFPQKYGCKTNGKNVDAGKLANGDPEAGKAAKKAKKFKA
jgi:hypothetical protein